MELKRRTMKPLEYIWSPGVSIQERHTTLLVLIRQRKVHYIGTKQGLEEGGLVELLSCTIRIVTLKECLET